MISLHMAQVQVVQLQAVQVQMVQVQVVLVQVLCTVFLSPGGSGLSSRPRDLHHSG